MQARLYFDGSEIPPSAFESRDDPGRFVDTAPAMGLDAPGGAGGVVVDDFDGDGLFDVVVSSVDACAPLRYYHNEGDGTFRTFQASEQIRCFYIDFRSFIRTFTP